MSASMAEVLAEHRDWVWLASTSDIGCDGCDWRRHLPWDESGVQAFAAHQAGVLAANGYGKLEDAWDEGLDAGQDRWMDAREFGDPPINPYRRPE